MEIENYSNRSELYGGLVWLIASASMIVYAGLIFSDYSLPGVEELVSFIASVEGEYVFGAAFLASFVESVYVVGSFFPGSTLVMIVAILAQTSGMFTFVGTMLAIYVGWVLAGVVNIIVTKYYRQLALKQADDVSFVVRDRTWVTWFPAFRANYEVAQVTAGANPWQVLWSSIRVKTIVMGILTVVFYLTPYIYDINQTSNEEGAVSLLVVAVICLVVGVVKIRKYLKIKQQNSL